MDAADDDEEDLVVNVAFGNFLSFFDSVWNYLVVIIATFG